MNSNPSQPQGIDPVALITGTSSGFGLLTAITLARRGYRVIATMRDLGRSKELVQQAEQAGVRERIHLLALDVTDEASIASAIQESLELA